MGCLVFISATIAFNNKSGLHKFDYTLKDGESLSIDQIFNSFKEEDLILEKSFPALNSAIIRSFETDSNNVMDLVTYINSISSNRNVGYWSIIPETRISDPLYAFYDDNGFIWRKSDGFGKFYHSLFRSKTARSILFNQALDILVSLCKTYPTDFKKSVLNELDHLLTFSNSLKSLNSSTDTDNLNDYWKGFIFRRHHLDNIPISEIQAFIINAQLRLNAIDVSKQPDAMYEININNQLAIFYSSEKFILYSKSSEKEINFTYDNSVQSIKYFKDNTGDYYQLTGVKNSVPFKYLFDKNLLKIE